MLQTGDCFVAGTLVWTMEGPKPIEKIKIGEQVLSRNMATGELEFHKVHKIFSLARKGFLKAALGESEVICSNNHRFFVNGQWLMAKELQAGTRLFLSDRDVATVRETGKLATAQRV